MEVRGSGSGLAMTQSPGMRLLGSVSTEGGPVLLADLDGVGRWQGIDGDDYARACAQLDESHATGFELTLGSRIAAIWDIPPGTAEVWRSSTIELVLSRPWLAEHEEHGHALAVAPFVHAAQFATIEIVSGWLTVLWAAESGGDVTVAEPTDGYALDLSVGNAGLIAALPPGRYRCAADRVETAANAS